LTLDDKVCLEKRREAEEKKLKFQRCGSDDAMGAKRMIFREIW
jgi:hypothetical protein